MCGIAGMIRWGGSPVLESEIVAMVSALAHRGPDAHGVFIEGGV